MYLFICPYSPYLLGILRLFAAKERSIRAWGTQTPRQHPRGLSGSVRDNTPIRWSSGLSAKICAICGKRKTFFEA